MEGEATHDEMTAYIYSMVINLTGLPSKQERSLF